MSSKVCMAAYLYLLMIYLGRSFALECWPQEERLPLYDNCHDIVSQLSRAARNPEENLLKTWGFMLPDGRQTARLPKGFYIGNLPFGERNECGAFVDAILEDPIAIDRFRLEHVAWAARRVLTRCLANGKSGEEFPSAAYNPNARHMVRVRFIHRPGPIPSQYLAWNATDKDLAGNQISSPKARL